MYMDIARRYSHKSKCQFYKVGAIAVNSHTGRIFCTGVNGTAPGSENCSDLHMTRDEHREFGNDYEIHAEMNLILEMARTSGFASKLVIYVTSSPCKNCLKHLLGLSNVSMQVETIVWDEQYHRNSLEDMMAMSKQAARHGVAFLSMKQLQQQLGDGQEP